MMFTTVRGRFKNLTGTIQVDEQNPANSRRDVRGAGKDPWGGERAGFTARTEIDRREWGLMWNQALETGGRAHRHAVKIEIEAQAVKQTTQAEQLVGQRG